MVDPPSNTKAAHVAVGVSVVWAITKDKKVRFVKHITLYLETVLFQVLLYTYTLKFTWPSGQRKHKHNYIHTLDKFSVAFICHIYTNAH